MKSIYEIAVECAHLYACLVCSEFEVHTIRKIEKERVREENISPYH